MIIITLEEVKIKILSLIEEYDENEENLTADEDIANKINSVINQIQFELARFKKINAYESREVNEGEVIEFNTLENFYQLNIVRGLDCDIIGERIKCNEAGTLEIHYYKYPTRIDIDTDDSFEFELSDDVIEVLVYGVAADLLKSDVSSNYGRIYAERYAEMKRELDPRYAMGSVYIDTSNSVDI